MIFSCLSLLSALLFSFPSPVLGAMAVGKATVSGENDLSFYNNDVRGPGSDSSYLTPHGNYDDRLSLNADWAGAGEARWSSQLQGRFTNDPRVDLRNATLQRFSLDRFSPQRHISIGDFYASFTQYSLNQNLKGLRLEEQNLAGLQVGVLAGVAKNRWDDLWMSNPSDQVSRYVAGAQVHRDLPLGSEIGFSLVGSRDSRTSGSTADEVGENLLGVNWALPSDADLAISGESAWSKAAISSLGGGETDKSASAHRASARSRYRRWRTWEDFENVSPDFVTTAGAAPADLRRFQTRHELKLNSRFEALANYSWYRNNLDGQLTDTAQTSSPEGGLRWLAPFNRSSLNLEGRLRYRKTTHSSALPWFEATSEILSGSDRFGNLNADLQYEHRDENRPGSQKDSRNTVGLGLSGFWKWREAIFRPFARYNLDLDDDQIAGGTNQVTEGTLGLSADITPEIYASFNYRLSRIYNIGADSVQRDNYDARLGYNISGPQGDRVELGYRNDFNGFATGSKNYREEVWETDYVHKI